MPTLLVTALALLGLMSALWILSVLRRDVSLIDIFWGPAFVLVAWLAFGNREQPEHWLLPVLTTVWGLRLGTHLALRKRGHGEDRRYQALRKAAGEQFWWTSLFTVFWLQGALVWIISLPLQFSPMSAPTASRVSLTIGVCLFALCLTFETVGDWQLARFQANKENRGKVLDQGLWRYTRHPNYFGDCCVWWGLWLCAISQGVPVWTVISPIVMTTLLLRVSGVSLLERDLVQSKPGYAEYVRKTSSFIPLPPRD